MNPTTYSHLLRDLQKVQKALVATHVESVRNDDVLQAEVARRHAAAEVGGRFDDFVALEARRNAVRFLLRTVYVRVLEDLGALEPRRIRGDWGFAAFREVAPALGVRAYLAFVFRDLARDFPALFSVGEGELPLPPEDAVRAVWNLWQHPNREGERYEWNGEGFDSRFLGDLYQDLDADIRKRFALLQTPRFIEEYILDRTLTPALVEFDPAALRERGETFRLLDPTCGSGHFLAGTFGRLADWWEAREFDKWTAVVRALESVWGCDINPHAVDIARFRILLEVIARTGVTDLKRLAGLQMNMTAMDSLIPWERGGAHQQDLFPASDRLTVYGTPEERAANAAFLGRAFHVVVANPPYITPKDVRKKEDYRAFWPDSCHMRYALSAPFAERLFVLSASGGWVGQITANSFMKREFGKKLVERVFPRWDLTGVVDTSGAYIPGHGTPTVVLFGRAQSHVSDMVWALLGKRGEPRRPEVPAQGLVWSAIANAGKEPNDDSPFITVDWRPRSAFHLHPWSLGGGEASDVKDEIERASTRLLGTHARLGMMTILKQDDIYFGFPPGVVGEILPTVLLVEGTFVRDYAIDISNSALFPYDAAQPDQPILLPRNSAALHHFWNYRAHLRVRTSMGFRTIEERGMNFYEYPFYFPDTYLGPVITFAFVSTHNHFVLDRGGKVFNRSAPVIKLPGSASVDDHLDLLGLLNSSTLGFWMKQVFHCKGSSSGEAIRSEDWEPFWEYDSTKLQATPLVARDREARVALARALDFAARERAACLPAAILASEDWTPAGLGARLAEARTRYVVHTERMVALQEELDWLTYASYGLIEPVETVYADKIEALSPGHRPFEIRFARQDDEVDPDEQSAWWKRHGHDRVTEVPARYSVAHHRRIEERINRIEENPRLQLLEGPAYKRRWQVPEWDKEVRTAAESWLLDRLEDLFDLGGPLAAPRPYRLEKLVAPWSHNPRLAAVAGTLTGTGLDVDLTLVAEPLLRKHALPDNPHRVYSAEGLRKRGEWKRVWALQEQEDRGEPLHDPVTGTPLEVVPLPPKFEKTDFRTPDTFAIRGKLDVPRERFIAFADLRPPRWGWNGWRDRDRALAQVEAFDLAERDPEDPLPAPTTADPRRCGVTLGLWESLPDVARWGDAAEHGEFLSLAREACKQSTCPCAIAAVWESWAARGSTGIPSSTASAVPAGPPVSLQERSELEAALLLHGATGATLRELRVHWSGPPARLPAVIDDLLATGHLAEVGGGRSKRYRAFAKE